MSLLPVLTSSSAGSALCSQLNWLLRSVVIASTLIRVGGTEYQPQNGQLRHKMYARV